jgi:acetyl-CoA acetyltransferase
VGSHDFARRLPVEPVRVLACELLSGQDTNLVGGGIAARAARRAYESAGVGPQDLDVVELHDAAAPAELQLYEELDLCERDCGPELLRSGASDLGGSLPVNTSGGLLARGHPIGATGCAQIVELVDQLRGRCGPRQVSDARIALAENGGGSIGDEAAAAVVTVLST